MHVSSAFDGGNIEVLATTPGGNGEMRLELAIRKDHKSEFFQWFYFRVSGAKGTDLTCAIANAHEASYPAGWKGYQAVMSYDRQSWERIETRYDDKCLSFRLTPRQDIVYFAYFAPFSQERHQDLLARAAASPHVAVTTLGQTVDGSALDCITYDRATTDNPLPVWFIARQHPGETMAEWFMEGLVNELLTGTNPAVDALCRQARFYLVPNMNPDGSFRGHLRTNAAGVNLNRVWSDNNPETSPEVYYVRRHMEKTGVRFALDVHGDEGLPYAFIAGSGGIPSLTEGQSALLKKYPERLATINEAFQTEHGYPAAPAGKGNLAMASNNIAETFGALAMTLEMPFKDPANAPDPEFGWSPARSQQLAADCLTVLAELRDDLKELGS